MKFLAILILSLNVIACSNTENDALAYTGYCKINECNGLTKPEFLSLKSNGLLKEQVKYNSSNDATAAGLMAATLASSGRK